MITLSNNFHGTTVRIRACIGDTLTPSQVKRCRRVLCGIKGCMCGGPLSERGQQYDATGKPFDVIATGMNIVRLEATP